MAEASARKTIDAIQIDIFNATSFDEQGVLASVEDNIN